MIKNIVVYLELHPELYFLDAYQSLGLDVRGDVITVDTTRKIIFKIPSGKIIYIDNHPQLQYLIRMVEESGTS